MDLRSYYRKIREVESTITSPFVIVVGVETPDGGKAGTCAQVSRAVAARLVVESRARLATEQETKDFGDAQAEAQREAEALAASQRMQVTIVPSAEYRTKPTRSSKEQ